MATDNSGELNAFNQFITTQLKTGSNLTPEEAVEQWRAMHPSDDAADLEAAIQEALDDIEAGEKGIPFDEFMREFRIRNGLK